MIHLPISTIAQYLHLPYNTSEHICTSVSIDSRTLTPGALFIAITGPNFDGHQFIDTAIAKGACAILAHQPIVATVPVLMVPDTRLALGTLAAAYRKQYTLPVFGLTGSCGKTTTKTLLATILESVAPTLSSTGTLNNDYGVPLTLLKLSPQDQFAVIEMGANHTGEIDYCARIAQPTHALITNAAPVHLEGFGSLDGVATAKSEIYASLSDTGVALIPTDDAYANFWKKVAGSRTTITFGTHPSADIFADHLFSDPTGSSTCVLHTPLGNTQITLPLPGKHNLKNAIAAAAGAYALGISLEAIQEGLAQAKSMPHRMQKHESKQGALIVDDSYNANPTAFCAAIEWLSHQTGKKILVMGDMGEMGSYANEGHRSVGEAARVAGIDHLFTYGSLSAIAAEAFGKGSHHFEDRDALIHHLHTQLDAQTVVLIKGSRSMKMERVVEGIMQ